MTLLANSKTTEVERDTVLWKEMKEGNEFAFHEIFDRYSNLLFQYGLTLIKDRELIKDCVQELFISLWTNRQNIGTARSIKNYIFFSLRRIILKRINKAKKFVTLTAFAGKNHYIESVDQSIVNREKNERDQYILSRELDQLPARQKEIIFLKFYQGLSNQEIESIMSLNSQVVRNTLCKALKSLRKQMEKNKALINMLCFIALLFCEAYLK